MAASSVGLMDCESACKKVVLMAAVWADLWDGGRAFQMDHSMEVIVVVSKAGPMDVLLVVAMVSGLVAQMDYW